MKQSNDLRQELDFFRRCKPTFLQNFPGLFVVVRGDEWIGPFPSAEAAYQGALGKLDSSLSSSIRWSKKNLSASPPSSTRFRRSVPIYNHYYPDANNQINTPASAVRLAAEGPTIPVTIGVPTQLAQYLQSTGQAVPSPLSGNALIDTGASVCMVDDGVVRSLNLPPSGMTAIHSVSGQAQHPTYAASLPFPGTTLPNIAFTDYIGSPLAASGIIAIIGRNILMHFVHVYNGPSGSLSLTF